MTTSKTRERRIIALVACPHCGVRAGMPCTVITPGDQVIADTGRIWVHGDRKVAWQMARDGETPQRDR